MVRKQNNSKNMSLFHLKNVTNVKVIDLKKIKFRILKRKCEIIINWEEGREGWEGFGFMSGDRTHVTIMSAGRKPHLAFIFLKKRHQPTQ